MYGTKNNVDKDSRTDDVDHINCPDSADETLIECQQNANTDADYKRLRKFLANFKNHGNNNVKLRKQERMARNNLENSDFNFENESNNAQKWIISDPKRTSDENLLTANQQTATEDESEYEKAMKNVEDVLLRVMADTDEKQTVEVYQEDTSSVDPVNEYFDVESNFAVAENPSYVTGCHYGEGPEIPKEKVANQGKKRGSAARYAQRMLGVFDQSVEIENLTAEDTALTIPITINRGQLTMDPSNVIVEGEPCVKVKHGRLVMDTSNENSLFSKKREIKNDNVCYNQHLFRVKKGKLMMSHENLDDFPIRLVKGKLVIDGEEAGKMAARGDHQLVRRRKRHIVDDEMHVGPNNHITALSNFQKTRFSGQLMLNKKWNHIAWLACICVSVCGISWNACVPLAADKGLSWIKTCSLALLTTYCLLHPAVCLAQAIYFTYVFEVAVELKRHRLPRYVRRLDYESCINYRHSKQSCYSPHPYINYVSDEDRMEKKKARMLRRLAAIRIWSASCCLLLVMLLEYGGGGGGGDIYYVTHRVRDLLVHATSTPATIPLDSCTNYTRFMAYLEYTIIPTVMRYDETLSSTSDRVNYDGEPRTRIMDRAYTADHNYKLLADVRLRQIRVRPDNGCRGSDRPSPDDCVREINIFNTNVDTDDYGVGWRPLVPGEHALNITTNIDMLPWTWRREEGIMAQGTAGRMYPLSLYDSSGYSTYLGKSATNANHTLQFIHAYNWIDDHTRVVFIELTMYNGNVDVYSMVIVKVEISAAGVYVPSYQIYSRRLSVWSWLSLVITALLTLSLISAVVCIFRYLSITRNLRGVVKDIVWQTLCVSLLVTKGVTSLRTDHVFGQLDSLPNMQYINFHSVALVASISDVAASTSVSVLFVVVCWMWLCHCRLVRWLWLDRAVVVTVSGLFVYLLLLALICCFFFLLYRGSSDEGWSYVWGGWGVSVLSSMTRVSRDQQYVFTHWQLVVVAVSALVATRSFAALMANSVSRRPRLRHLLKSCLQDSIDGHKMLAITEENMKKIVSRELISQQMLLIVISYLKKSN